MDALRHPSAEGLKLLLRSEYRAATLGRDGHACVVCGAKASDGVALDPHHLLERKSFPDGGYYLDNLVTLCDRLGGCHMRAEQTLISPDELRQAAGITRVVLPPGFDDEAVYTKWLDIEMPSGMRSPGPFFYDESVQKLLAAAGVLDRYGTRFKYPRTLHLPTSPNRGADGDHAHTDYAFFEGREVVVTLKLDGESTTCGRDYIHARSAESGYHHTRTWVTRLHSQFAFDIPSGWRICGENVYGQHSIAYKELPSYFFVYAIYNERNECLSWDDTVEWAELFGLHTVPVLYRGIWSEQDVMKCYPRPMYGGEAEGFVVRTAGTFSYWDHWKNTGKFVRAGHVKTEDGHWRHGEVLPNKLA